MKPNKNLLFLFLSLFFIILSNQFFNYDQSLIYGGSDGQHYVNIAKSSPYFGENIAYIKGERFIIPYLIGFFSKILNIEIYFLFRLLSFVSILVFILLFYRSLSLIRINEYQIFVSLGLLIFNPYIIRYFVSIPTSLMDNIFILSLIIIIFSFLINKKFLLYVGFFLSIAARQNGLFVFITFVILKLIFKKNSNLNQKDILILSIIFILTFFLNTYYAINSQGPTSQIKEIYLMTLFGVFYQKYSLKEFLQYILFPLLSFGPIIIYSIYLYLKNNLDKDRLKSEISLFIIILSILIFGIAFVGGPEVTGKNLNRLCNFSYLSILFLINYLFHCRNNLQKTIPMNYFLIIPFFLIWSSHPTFSNFKYLSFLKILFI